MKFIVDKLPESVYEDCPFSRGDYCKIDGCSCKGMLSGAVTCQGLITFDAYMKGGSIPCSVGDVVYGFTYPRTDIAIVVKERVKGITVTETGVEIDTTEDCYSPSDFGKRVFLTEKEAEAALAARRT